MAKKVFNYRVPEVFGFACIPLALALYWAAYILFCWPTGSFEFKLPTVENRDDVWFLVGTLSISVALAIWSVCLFLHTFNTRIEIEGNKIKAFNCLGILVAKADLPDVRLSNQVVWDIFGNSGLTIYLIGKRYSIYRQLRGMGDLLKIFFEHARHAETNIPLRRPDSGYLPQDRLYRYCWSQTHLGFLAICGIYVILFICLIVMSILGAARHKHSYGISSFSLIPLGLLFIQNAYFAFFKFWHESIKLGPDGLIRTDPFGRKKVKCSIHEILGFKISNSQRYLNIYTTQGIISVRQDMPGYADLCQEMFAIVNSYPPYQPSFILQY